jgi:hypothetical protein
LDGWWDEELVSSEEEEETADATQDHGCEKKHTFGPIPRFTRVFEVKVCVVRLVKCSGARVATKNVWVCPAVILLQFDSILGKDSTGFPLSSIHMFWWNQYYLYVMSSKDDHRKSKEAMVAFG